MILNDSISIEICADMTFKRKKLITVKPRFSNIQNSKKPRFSKHFAADRFFTNKKLTK